MQQTLQRKSIYNGLRNLLPTTGNVIFTVFMIGITLWAQSAGAFYSAAPATETETTTLDSQNSTIPYQGYLTDDEGQPLDGDYDITFRLYAQSSGGSPIWTEQRTGANKVTLTDGLFTVRLGSVNTISRSVIVDNDELYLGVTIGNDNELTPRVELNSILDMPSEAVAYHFYDSFATQQEWVADLIFNENHQRFCEAIDKTFVKGKTLTKHYNHSQTNGFFYKNWYYIGHRYHEADEHIYGTKPDNPGWPYTVWKYKGEGEAGCCVGKHTAWTMSMSAIIWCK